MSAPRSILVLNCGSSSVKGALVDPKDGRRYGVANATGLGSDEAHLDQGEARAPLPDTRHSTGIDAVLSALLDAAEGASVEVMGVGHRVVHGGERFVAPTHVDEEVVSGIEALVPLAPLHNPANLEGIRAARRRLPELPHIAVFDTAFHATLPRRASTYAIDQELAGAHGIRRYGFHGTSHAYVSRRAAEAVGEALDQLRIISCHLGNGASVAAVEWGRSIETSMGLTPLEGLVMGTRSGDIDPGAALAIARSEGMDLDALDELLNQRSGLLGISGISQDMRKIEAAATEGHDRARLAIQVFCHRVLKYIGAYAAVMGGVDLIVFTGGIGENSRSVRHRICTHLAHLGLRLDADANDDVALSADAPVAEFSAAGSRCRALAVHTDEAGEIARAAAAIVDGRDAVGSPGPIPIAVSARHIHLTRASLDALFGPGHTLTELKPLSQPGQYACEEVLTIIGPKGRIEGVRILGPLRGKNQIEISRTDEFHLGIDAPVRPSGKTQGSAPCILEGPAGRLELSEGVICAARHIHMTPQDAEAYGVEHGDIVEVAVDSPGRDLVFGDVLVRVSPKYALEMHIDTDEANAAELPRQGEGMLAATPGKARLTRRST